MYLRLWKDAFPKPIALYLEGTIKNEYPEIKKADNLSPAVYIFS